ncbi:MAG: hypothetical protein Pg6C_07140 [Treponemataceae bacterium]|nr:MAG: hypothetical protein Pg6C_07140 [Treponemataceae bacterium]
MLVPAHSSWLNVAARRFAEIANKRIRRESRESAAQLAKAVRDYIQAWNKSGRKFVWTKKAETVLASIEKAKQPVPHFV